MPKTLEQLKEETAREFEKMAYGEYANAVANWSMIDFVNFLSSTQQQAYNLAMERVKESLDIVWKEMTERTYKHTLEGKNSPFEVTQEDWDNSSFTIEEFKERILSSLTTDKNIT